ncbi:TIGR01440 family protein [Aerococcus kribbianus]|uniref:UPF0340 protein OW157_04345 n=1 Tax=Aerococcus kribbianus TaxID=2999064 RepID=A0A9X3FSC8_9LACT|nr:MULTISPECIES: TIGR01440 family protein [unclassified Aerococcus]MCZ0717512.1 TIGR01440 family protein [Aerococcus sp. YH-aer221]MCZ0725800.1 TIGR01440 family protein [Aerococcus sp. YH-aer222]
MFETLQADLQAIVEDVLSQAKLSAGDIFVLGCSTSEIQGDHIGKNSSPEIGEMIISTLLDSLGKKDIYLAVQGCEHINRALVVEAELAKTHQLEIVNVRPQYHAGGACSVAAFEQMVNPVEVEHIVGQAGIDIGDTAIGMHIKHVQVPVRPQNKSLGQAHVTALRSRPKYIGGSRANY